MSDLPAKDVQNVLKKRGVKFAYLFGSRVRGRSAVRLSDYDIAVFFGAGSAVSRFAKRLRLQHELENAIHAPVDVVVLDDARSVSLRHEISVEGRVLADFDPEARLDFEFRALYDYEDFAPFLRQYNQAYLKASV